VRVSLPPICARLPLRLDSRRYGWTHQTNMIVLGSGGTSGFRRAMTPRSERLRGAQGFSRQASSLHQAGKQNGYLLFAQLDLEFIAGLEAPARRCRPAISRLPLNCTLVT